MVFQQSQHPGIVGVDEEILVFADMRDHHTDDSAFLGGKASGRGIGLVIVLLDDLLDAPDGLLGDLMVVAVDDIGDGCSADAGLLCYRFQIHDGFYLSLLICPALFLRR